MTSSENLKKLYAIAEEDHIYNAWKRSYEECIEPFQEFADAQPEEIRRILYGYADGGRLMVQRVSNIACDYMEFPEKSKRKSGAV